MLFIITLIVYIQALDWNMPQQDELFAVTSDVHLAAAMPRGKIEDPDQGDPMSVPTTQIEREFIQYDLDGDEQLTLKELLLSFGSDHEVRPMFGRADKDMDNVITLSEFIKYRTRDSLSEL